VGGFTEGFPASKTAAAYMTLCPNCRTIQKAPIEGEGVICPFCSRGWLDSLETSDPEKYREYKERTEHESEKMHERRREERGVPRVSMYIEPKLRKKVNAELRNAGMDGNGRFETAGAALTEAIEIISNYGLRPTVDVSQGLGDSDILTEDFRNEGSRNLELETLDGEPVENSMLVFRYYQFLETGKYEILAMLS
jgi:Zn-finger nucleic acid-binding protein